MQTFPSASRQIILTVASTPSQSNQMQINNLKILILSCLSLLRNNNGYTYIFSFNVFARVCVRACVSVCVCLCERPRTNIEITNTDLKDGGGDGQGS